MSEGPQVKLISERLQRNLQGLIITDCKTTRGSLRAFSDSIKGAQVEQVFCKGKHIFFHFSSEQFLQNHLLMRGRWKTIKGRMLLLPAEIWLALETGNTTVVNINGQILCPLGAEGLQQQLVSLSRNVK